MFDVHVLILAGGVTVNASGLNKPGEEKKEWQLVALYGIVYIQLRHM
jgi:hypothetical protein